MGGCAFEAASPGCLQGAQGFQGVGDVSQNGDLVLEGIGDHSIVVDNVRDPSIAQSEPATSLVEACDLVVRIRDQGKRQVVFFPETGVAFGGVRADSGNERAGRCDGFIGVTEATSLVRSAACEVPIVEVEDDESALKF